MDSSQTSPLPLLPSLTLIKDRDAAYLDIIAIHGIMEPTPSVAWSCPSFSLPPSSPDSEPINWLADDRMLPAVVSNIRVWEFRYVTRPLKGREHALKTHINDTALALRTFIRGQILQVSNRPLLFITHGYGGLIAFKTVLQAVVCARTIGIVCLGTPFRPTEEANAIPFALPVPNPERGLLALTEEINALPELLQDFRSGKGTDAVPLRCFYETADVRLGSFEGKIVPKTAAVLDNPNTLSFSLDTDHYNLNKFASPADHNYALVVDVVSGIVDNAYPWMLTQAAISGDVAYARTLIEDHALDFPTNDSLAKALKATIVGGQVEILRLMLDANIRLNLCLTAEKDTALILAVRLCPPNCHLIVQELLQKGADISAVNEDGKSARDYANDASDQDLLAMLGRSFILGPALSRRSFKTLHKPHLVVDDFDSSKFMRAKLVDVYVVQGVERIFLKSPSVHELIYEHGPNHLMSRARAKETEEGQKRFRWIHLPSNNILWIKDLIKRYYTEAALNDSDFDRQQYYSNKCDKLTSRIHWEDVVSKSPLPELSYVRHMTPRCRTFPYERSSNTSARDAMFAPDTQGDALADNEEYAGNVAQQKRGWGEAGYSDGTRPAYGGSNSPIHADMIFSMPYLHYESTAQRDDQARTIRAALQKGTKMPVRPDKNTPDQNAVWAYIRARDMPLHPRRTLDQSYYDAVDSDSRTRPDVPTRNEDQVTQRFMRSQPDYKVGDDTLMLMVDQLWMVLLEDDTLITAFPQQWGVDFHEVNPIKEADIANMIVKELSNRKRQPLESAFDMMMLVLRYCTGVLFDADAHQNERLRFFTFFERIIQQVANQESAIFTHLKEMFQTLGQEEKARDRDENLRKLLDELLDITLEVDMLNEIKDIHDELFMISRVLEQQSKVINQMSNFLKNRAVYNTTEEQDVFATLLLKWEKVILGIEQRQNNLFDMDLHAHKTFKNINNLFDMKQRQASVLEVHYSRKVSQDSGRQALTVFVFTLVTVIFLPLSFMSSFFTLPISEFPRDPNSQNAVSLPFHYASIRVFGIGFGIALLIVITGFGVNVIKNHLSKSPPVLAPAASGSVGSSIKASAARGSSRAVTAAAAAAAAASGTPSFATGALSYLDLTGHDSGVGYNGVLRRRDTPLRSPDGGKWLLRKKRVVYGMAKQNGMASFTYESIVKGGPATSSKEGPGIHGSKGFNRDSPDTPSNRSWWSFPWRSSPQLGGDLPISERNAPRRHTGSWGIMQEDRGWPWRVKPSQANETFAVEKTASSRLQDQDRVKTV